MKIEYKIVICS